MSDQSKESPLVKGQLVIEKLHWIVNEFSSYRLETGKWIESAVLSSNGANQLKAQFRIYPNGAIEEYKDRVSVAVFVDCLDESHLPPEVQLSILNGQGECNFSRSTRVKLPSFNKETWVYPFLISRAELLDPANQLLINDTLTICCQLGNLASNSQLPATVKDSKLQLAADIGRLLENSGQLSSDVTLLVRDSEFRAHKTVLSARSAVFAAMFQLGLTDREPCRVEIADVELGVFGEFLRFIYTGEVGHLDEMVEPLLAAADNYDIGDLKVICQQELAKRLEIENAAKTLIQADRQSAARLKEKAIDFINQHSAQVLHTDGWKDLVEFHPKLIAEIYAKLVTK